jgi:hypothetical protein
VHADCVAFGQWLVWLMGLYIEGVAGCLILLVPRGSGVLATSTDLINLVVVYSHHPSLP